MAEDNNTGEPDNLVLVYLRRIDTRLEGGGGLEERALNLVEQPKTPKTGRRRPLE